MNKSEIQLNKEQKEAVLHQDGPLLIVAGAGTGKTALITARIANLISQGLAKSDEILALTFTEKAAGEMEERVDKLLPMGYFDLWISTFHSFGEKILRESGLDIGVPADFKLLDEFQQYRFLKNNLDKFELDYYRPLGNPTKFIRALIAHFSRLKDEDIEPEQYLQYAKGLDKSLAKKESLDIFLNNKGEFDEAVAELEVKKINEVARAYQVYQQLLPAAGLLDFGDLINYCLKLFRKRPNVLEKYRKKFKYILLDEFQDTNWSQYELIKLLAAPSNNLCVVGDDDQSIFRFRGASMSNILQFQKDYPASKKIFLKTNYRNTQNILDLSYDFINLNNPNRLEYQLKEDKDSEEELDKKLIADTSKQGTIELIEGADADDEIEKIVSKIADLKIKDKEAGWNDFAILTRANAHAKAVGDFLESKKFPYLIYSSKGLYNKEVIINSITYLKSLVDHYDNASFFKVLSLPFFNFTFEEILNLNQLAKKKAWSIFQVMDNAAFLKIPTSKQIKINNFLKVFKKHAEAARENRASDIFISFINDTGYLSHLLKENEAKHVEAVNFLEAFLKRIRKFEEDAGQKTTKDFLLELEEEMEAGEAGSLPFDINSGPETIKIMTVHAAKGLEFKYVFVINLVDQRFPSTEKKEQIQIPDSLVKEIVPEGEHHLEEERRLFYVAITRAKRGIWFSYASDYGGKRAKKPSRFLVETNLVAESTKGSVQKKVSIPQSNLLQESQTDKAVPEFQPAVPKSFSYTQLAAFSNCPYQYRFAHILKIPVAGKPAFSFGKTMHLSLQKIFEKTSAGNELDQESLFKDQSNKDISLEECLKIYQESWVDDWYPSEKVKEEYRQKGQEIITTFWQKYKNDWPRAVMLEKGFSTKINVDGEIFTIRGQIDRIDEQDGKIKIVDYKTGNPKDKLEFKDKEQLFIYQIAASEIFRKEIGELAFYYLDNNTEVKFLGSDKELEKMKEKTKNIISEIKKSKFPPKPGPLCKFCDFNSICEFRKL